MRWDEPHGFNFFLLPLLNTSAREVGDLVGVVTRSRVLVMITGRGYDVY